MSSYEIEMTSIMSKAGFNFEYFFILSSRVSFPQNTKRLYATLFMYCCLMRIFMLPYSCIGA